MDISAEVAAIQAASQGSELRQPLIGALNKLNNGSLPAVTASDVGKILKVGANGWEVGEKSGYIPVPTATKQITENGTHDVTNYANVNVAVSGGGGIIAAGIGPFLGFSDLMNQNGTIRINAYASDFNILSSGHISTDFVNSNILIICSTNDLINNPCISISGFTSLYRNTEIEVFYGTLRDDTAISISVDQFIYISIIAISSDYTPTIYQNLCSNSGTTLVDTEYLKTVYAFGIACAHPTGYGIFVCTSNYDYSDTSYRPTIWQPVNNFINAPEIMLRAADDSKAGSNRGTGFAVFCKRDTSAYNQYYVRGSARDIQTTGSLMSISNFMSNPFNVSNMKFYNVPRWSAPLYTAYIKLEKDNS